MDIRIGLKLSPQEVLSLLKYFDDSSEIPLSMGLDFDTYSRKLSQFAYFVIATKNKKQMGFIAYYLNDEKHFAYVPQVVVHKEARHQGLGHSMFYELYNGIKSNYPILKLEVLKSNTIARNFYTREGFKEKEDNNVRILLVKELRQSGSINKERNS